MQSFVEILSFSVGVEADNAASEVRNFIRKLLKQLNQDLYSEEPDSEPPSPLRQSQSNMYSFFKQNGGAMIDEYFSALLRIPSKGVAEIFIDAIGIICVTFMEEGNLVMNWVQQAVQKVPINVFTVEN